MQYRLCLARNSRFGPRRGGAPPVVIAPCNDGGRMHDVLLGKRGSGGEFSKRRQPVSVPEPLQRVGPAAADTVHAGADGWSGGGCSVAAVAANLWGETKDSQHKCSPTKFDLQSNDTAHHGLVLWI